MIHKLPIKIKEEFFTTDLDPIHVGERFVLFKNSKNTKIMLIKIGDVEHLYERLDFAALRKHAKSVVYDANVTISRGVFSNDGQSQFEMVKDEFKIPYPKFEFIPHMIQQVIDYSSFKSLIELFEGEQYEYSAPDWNEDIEKIFLKINGLSSKNCKDRADKVRARWLHDLTSYAKFNLGGLNMKIVNDAIFKGDTKGLWAVIDGFNNFSKYYHQIIPITEQQIQKMKEKAERKCLKQKEEYEEAIRDGTLVPLHSEPKEGDE